MVYTVTEEDLFAFILSGEYFTLATVKALHEYGYLTYIEEERWRVIKPFLYLNAMAEIGSIIATAPNHNILPEVILLDMS